MTFLSYPEFYINISFVIKGELTTGHTKIAMQKTRKSYTGLGK
jgi:hypothetical protein